jgi:trehalose 6-phosphate phosphatase
MPPEPAIGETLAPLRSDPAHAALLFDIDGTLAPIVRHASDAHVPEETRRLLIALARRYSIVACVSGRPASVARQMVAIGSIAYVGNHGCELIAPGSSRAVVDQRVSAYADRVAAFARAADTAALQRARVRIEDKGPLVAFHWRGAPDEQAALAVIELIEADAHAAGLAVARGRKVLEVRPPVAIDKGHGVELLLRGHHHPGTGLYAGDDTTDIDGFAGLRRIVGDTAICVAVGSEEAPPELLAAATVIVDGTDGVRALLQELLR